MILSPVLRQRFFDNSIPAAPLVGGQLFSYIAGTTTPQVTYSNQGGTTNTNPVILDASGYADVWIDSTKAYKFVLEDSNNNVLWTEDNVNTQTAISVRTLTSNTVLLSSDQLVRSNSTGGALVMTLPACSTTSTGVQITVKDVGTGGFSTQVKGSGSDTIDGNNTYATILYQYMSRTFENTGSNWDVI